MPITQQDYAKFNAGMFTPSQTDIRLGCDPAGYQNPGGNATITMTLSNGTSISLEMVNGEITVN